MRKLIVLVALLFSLVAAPRAWGQGSAGETVERVSTTLVSVEASVLDRQGRFVPGVGRESFRLYEDGVEQEITYFEEVSRPFNVVLLLDASGSTRFRLEDIRAAANDFVSRLRPEDRVAVVEFDERVSVLSAPTADRRRVRDAISRTRTGDATRLYDAVHQTLNGLLRGVEGRKAVVLFTDGVDTASRLATHARNLEDAEEAGALVYTLQYDTFSATQPAGLVFGAVTKINSPPCARNGRNEVEAARATSYLSKLAEKTGARYFCADRLDDLRLAFSRIAEELGHQYTLAYYPARRGGEPGRRKIKVRVRLPGAAVRARASYVFRP